MAANEGKSFTETKALVIAPLTPEEEDLIIHTRITNDERPLRRVIKKFHNYTSAISLSLAPIPSSSQSDSASVVEDAREAFLIELSSFQLSLQKSAMICEAEARQVEEYEKERIRIDDEYGTLRGQIEQLKTGLEYAQMTRKRKMEYDLVAEKVNTLPTRDELESTIQQLENDMAAIRSEHETQTRTIQGQKAALDGIIMELSSLRFLGKDPDIEAATLTPLPTTPTPESFNESPEEVTEISEVEKADIQEEKGSSGYDIEMGELEEDEVKGSKGKKKRDEELEEGEATDASSELSEPPDDV